MPHFRFIPIVFATWLFAPVAPAQTTYTWTGGGANGNWSTANNWGGTLPTSSLTTTRISLAGTANTATTLDAGPWGSTFSALGLTIASGAGGFSVSNGGVTLELGAEGILASNGGLNAINPNIRLGAAQKWRNAGPERLPVSGAVDLNGFALTLGDSAAAGPNAWWIDVTGAISGGGGLTVQGRAKLTGANTYTGGTLVNTSGWLVVNSATNLGSGPVEVRGNSTLTLEAAVDSTLAQPLTITNTTSNDINAVQVNAAGGTLRLTGGLTGAGTFSLGGPGKAVFSGANPFTGTFYTGGYGSTDLVLNAGGVGSMAAAGYRVYYNQFRVAAGFALQNNPYILVDDSTVTVESAQSLAYIAVGQATSPVATATTKFLAPGVTTTLQSGVTTAYGTINANLAGTWSGTFYKAGVFLNTPGTDTTVTTVSGASTFVANVVVEGGTLSFDSIANAGTASALGAGGEFRIGTAVFGYRNPTLRYTGPTAATDRPLMIGGSASFPSTLEVTNAATTLTWNGLMPVFSFGTTFRKTGAGTLVLANAGNTFGGSGFTTTVVEGRLDVTGRMIAPVTVQTGATLGGKLVGTNTFNLGKATTVQAGGTLRAGTGGSADTLGANDTVTMQAGSKLLVTADGGATPTASRLVVNAGGVLRLQASTANKMQLIVEKGPGAEFAGGSPVTVEIARVLTTISDTNLIWSGTGSSPFAYNPAEWDITTVGFSIVPGSATLFTTDSGNVLRLSFTPVPEPASVLAVAALAGLVGFARRRAGTIPSCTRS
ncbi:MAG: PEP-CTERM sorting domain-containing protein [Gemmataceae bacterium]